MSLPRDVCRLQIWTVGQKSCQVSTVEKRSTELPVNCSSVSDGCCSSFFSFWYRGEIGFFDNYIVPLAKKLKDCGVFGVSSDECLTYALQNRNEWEERGQAIVEELIAEVEGENKTALTVSSSAVSTDSTASSTSTASTGSFVFEIDDMTGSKIYEV